MTRKDRHTGSNHRPNKQILPPPVVHR